MRSDIEQGKLQLIAFLGIGIVMIAFILLQPYFEMRSFNKFSKIKATYVDAVFCNLRVIAD